jgi:MFS family permease
VASRAVLVAVLGALTIGLDTAVNIALPAISAAFDVPATSIQWIVLAYVVTFAVALIPAGRLADRAGHGRVFQAGLLVTGVAHALCGLAPGWRGLLGARVVQGLGAALVMASAPALVTLSTDAGRRGRALGHLGLAASVGAVMGPLGGGFLLHAFGWRSVYLGRLPLVLLALGLGLGPSRPREPSRSAPPSMDATPLLGSDSAGLADRRLFLAANGAHLLANAALFAIWLLVPYYLIDRRAFAPGAGGLLFAAAPLAQACAMPLGGRAVDRGLGRALGPIGLAVESLGLWLTGRLDATADPGHILRALGLAGFGSGLFIVANMHYVMSALPRPRQGVAGSLISLMRTAGIVLGSTLTTATYATRQSAHAALGTEAAAARAYTDAFEVAAAVALAAVLLSLLPPRSRRRPVRAGEVAAP